MLNSAMTVLNTPSLAACLICSMTVFGEPTKAKLLFSQIFDVDRVARDLGAAGIAAFLVVLGKPLVADATVRAGAKDIGETVLEIGFSFRHGFGVGLIDVD